MQSFTAVDAHVHIHADADLDLLLSSAERNVTRLLGGGVQTCLLLTETARDDVFSKLRKGQCIAKSWRIERPKGDPSAIIARRDEAIVFVIAGSQIVTQERIEVLALANCYRFPDGETLNDTIQALHEHGIPTVLPWGLGKWIGLRGRLIAEQIARFNELEGRKQSAKTILLGDNKGRPRGWPTPSLFSDGPAVLPGSDPLPIPGSETTVGSFGFRLEGLLNRENPATDIVARLRNMTSSPPVFGNRLSPLAALRAQTSLRRAKRNFSGT